MIWVVIDLPNTCDCVVTSILPQVAASCPSHFQSQITLCLIGIKYCVLTVSLSYINTSFQISLLVQNLFILADNTDWELQTHIFLWQEKIDKQSGHIVELWRRLYACTQWMSLVLLSCSLTPALGPLIALIDTAIDQWSEKENNLQWLVPGRVGHHNAPNTSGHWTASSGNYTRSSLVRHPE